MALPRVPIYGRRTLNIVDGSSTWSTLVQFVFEDGNEGSEAIEVACAEIKTPSVVMAFTASMRGAFYGVAVRSLRHGERSRRFDVAVSTRGSDASAICRARSACT